MSSVLTAPSYCCLTGCGLWGQGRKWGDQLKRLQWYPWQVMPLAWTRVVGGRSGCILKVGSAGFAYRSCDGCKSK